MAKENTTPFQDPATMAREEAERLHKVAFPESYTEETEEETPASEEKEENPADDATLPTEDEDEEEPPPLAATEEDGANYWKQRFEVLQGKYNAEVPRMAEQIRELTDQMHELATRKPAQEQAPADPLSDALNRIADVYGEDLASDFLELAKAAAQTTTRENLKPVESELAQVRNTSTQTAQKAFEDALTQKVPNWRSIYSDPKFGQFLASNVEPYTGATYEQLFVHANNNWDLDRIATFFQTFDSSKTTTNPTTTPQQARQTPEHLITPARRGGGVQTQMENARGQIYTSKQITDFYQDIRDGKYKGQDAKIRQMKADFNKAAVEGRVVG
jgi:hypothetical protein